MRTIEEIIRCSISVKQALLADAGLVRSIGEVTAAMVAAFRADKKVLFCGNGGSAADAQHVAAELSGRFQFDRPPLFAEALHVNTSNLTAVANDYGYDEVYARAVRGAGRAGDVLIAFSTSGNSPNVLRAVEAGKAQGMVTVGLTGDSGGKLRSICDFLLNVPSRETARIQEAHIMIGHILCELVEASIFGGK